MTTLYTRALEKHEYDRMASEITEASVSIWDDTLSDTEEGIKLDVLWPILDKYLTQKGYYGTEKVSGNNNSE